MVVYWLRTRKICHAHPPNEGRRTKRVGARLLAAGLAPGLPDLLIFDPPPAKPYAVGVALEMKRANATKSAVRANQRAWLADLAERGWGALVGYGARDAIAKLQALGYGG